MYNLSGGIKAWQNETAVGPQDMGMEFFSGNESAEESIIAAFGLEEGLREFYLTMQAKVSDSGAQDLFAKLAAIEVHHQQRLVNLYRKTSGKTLTIQEFADNMAAPALEGGMTTEEYLDRYRPDLESITEILSLAMSIEAQALDLYQRAADAAAEKKSREVLQQIANEERAHLQQLAAYMDKS